jgi:hypothetical protein
MCLFSCSVLTVHSGFCIQRWLVDVPFQSGGVKAAPTAGTSTYTSAWGTAPRSSSPPSSGTSSGRRGRAVSGGPCKGRGPSPRARPLTGRGAPWSPPQWTAAVLRPLRCGVRWRARHVAQVPEPGEGRARRHRARARRGGVSCVRFSCDGKFLLSLGKKDRCLPVWRVCPPGAHVRVAWGSSPGGCSAALSDVCCYTCLFAVPYLPRLFCLLCVFVRRAPCLISRGDMLCFLSVSVFVFFALYSDRP